MQSSALQAGVYKSIGVYNLFMRQTIGVGGLHGNQFAKKIDPPIYIGISSYLLLFLMNANTSETTYSDGFAERMAGTRQL